MRFLWLHEMICKVLRASMVASLRDEVHIYTATPTIVQCTWTWCIMHTMGIFFPGMATDPEIRRTLYLWRREKRFAYECYVCLFTIYPPAMMTTLASTTSIRGKKIFSFTISWVPESIQVGWKARSLQSCCSDNVDVLLWQHAHILLPVRDLVVHALGYASTLLGWSIVQIDAVG